MGGKRPASAGLFFGVQGGPSHARIRLGIVVRCEKTGLSIPECSCPRCHQAQLRRFAPDLLDFSGGRNACARRLADVSRSLLTAAEVAELLGVPVSWVYEQSRQGHIPTVTLGRYRRYRAEAIGRWVEQLEAGDARPSSLAFHH